MANENHEIFVADVESDACQPTILVVDDEEPVRELLRDILEAQGCRVYLAPGGREALALFEARDFDGVFTDVGMPGMSGWELAQAIRGAESEDPDSRRNRLGRSGWLQQTEGSRSRLGSDETIYCRANLRTGRRNSQNERGHRKNYGELYYRCCLSPTGHFPSRIIFQSVASSLARTGISRGFQQVTPAVQGAFYAFLDHLQTKRLQQILKSA